MQLIILLELFTKCLQNCCNQFGEYVSQQRGLHALQDSSNLFPKLLVRDRQSRSKRLYVIIQLFAKKTVVLRTYSLDSDRIF